MSKNAVVIAAPRPSIAQIERTINQFETEQ